MNKRLGNLALRTKLFLISPKGVKITKIGVMSFILVSSAVPTFAIDANISAAITSLWGTMQTASHFAAGIGVATGAFMKKFSMGKPDKIDTGNKLIKDSILGWVMINGLGLILTYISDELFGGAGGTSTLTY